MRAPAGIPRKFEDADILELVGREKDPKHKIRVPD
jgi:hypothetical protein